MPRLTERSNPFSLSRTCGALVCVLALLSFSSVARAADEAVALEASPPPPVLMDLQEQSTGDKPEEASADVGLHIRNDALREACPIRLRPVLMTSLTIILALLPAAFGLGAGAETNGPLSIAVIGGMISSTLLTLVVVPAAYSLIMNKMVR